MSAEQVGSSFATWATWWPRCGLPRHRRGPSFTRASASCWPPGGSWSSSRPTWACARIVSEGRVELPPAVTRTRPSTTCDPSASVARRVCPALASDLPSTHTRPHFGDPWVMALLASPPGGPARPHGLATARWAGCARLARLPAPGLCSPWARCVGHGGSRAGTEDGSAGGGGGSGSGSGAVGAGGTATRPRRPRSSGRKKDAGWRSEPPGPIATLPASEGGGRHVQGSNVSGRLRIASPRVHRPLRGRWAVNEVGVSSVLPTGSDGRPHAPARSPPHPPSRRVPFATTPRPRPARRSGVGAAERSR